jgi:small conductance mechanosensitive channel
LSRFKNLDSTISAFLQGATRIALRVLLLIICFTLLGVNSSFIATALGAFVLAVAFALQTLMANFASGMVCRPGCARVKGCVLISSVLCCACTPQMLLFFRYFKVGDWVELAGVSGTVRSIQLFEVHLHGPGHYPCLRAVANPSFLACFGRLL